MLPKSITKVVKLLLILAPPLLIGVLIFRNGVDVPVLDEWDGTAPLFEKMADRSLGLGDFYAQHNEHRIFFPRLIFFALGRLTHWDIRAELWMIFLLTLVCLFNIWQIAQRSVSQKTGLRTSHPNRFAMGEAGGGSPSTFWLLFATSLRLFNPQNVGTFFGDFRLDSCSRLPVLPHAFGRRLTCAIHSISWPR